MKRLLVLAGFLVSLHSHSQELYVFTEPASNMPARSLSIKLGALYVTRDNTFGRTAQRYAPTFMLGLNKNFMLHLGTTFSNIHTRSFKYESASVYLKYRFLSNDDIHKHFRLAAFLDASATSAPFQYDEISLMGDKSGIEAGLIATQLINRVAVSSTISHTQVLDRSRKDKDAYIPPRNYQSINYSLSAGYLFLPKEYTDYNQTNLNLYVELLGQQILDRPLHYLDIAWAFQFIFKSKFKINLGYRVQLLNNMSRMNGTSWLLSFEYTILNALKRK